MSRFGLPDKKELESLVFDYAGKLAALLVPCQPEMLALREEEEKEAKGLLKKMIDEIYTAR